MVYHRIRDLREDSDLKQRQIAEYLHCSQQAYSAYECGEREFPIEVLISLADFYKTNIEYLLGLTDVKTYYKELK